MRSLSRIAILLLASLLSYGEAVAEAKIGMHLIQHVDDSTYSLDVSYDNSFLAHLRISCIDKCASNLTYSDTNVFFLRGAFGDGDTFVTLWAAGSADWIIIYRAHGGVVTKVLEQPSRELPAFGSTPDGRRVIILHNDTPGMYLGKELYGRPPGLTKADRAKIRRETTSLWLWGGTTYVPYHGDVVGGWETIK